MTNKQQLSTADKLRGGFVSTAWGHLMCQAADELEAAEQREAEAVKLVKHYKAKLEPAEFKIAAFEYAEEPEKSYVPEMIEHETNLDAPESFASFVGAAEEKLKLMAGKLEAAEVSLAQSNAIDWQTGFDAMQLRAEAAEAKLEAIGEFEATIEDLQQRINFCQSFLTMHDNCPTKE